MSAIESLGSWPAPAASQPINATVQIPGSKSLSNRYLILAALGRHPVRIEGLLRSRDTELMMQALRELGVVIECDETDETCVRITPPDGGVFHGSVTVDCGLAGTVMRFVPGLALFADGPVRFDGDKQAYERPMKPLLDGLEQLGARIHYDGRSGYLPFTLVPPVYDCSGNSFNPGHHLTAFDGGVGDSSKADSSNIVNGSERSQERDCRGRAVAKACRVAIDSSSSSQFVSSLLLIGSRLPGGLHLCHTGSVLPSLPHINMTIDDVTVAGGQVISPKSAEWIVRPGGLQLPDGVVVEPDLSNAAPFLGAALISSGAVRVPRWPRRTTQPGGLLPGILERMGAEVTWNGLPYSGMSRSSCANGVLEVRGQGEIHGLGHYDMSAAGEITPSIAALAALADGPTALVGIGHLRGHETNRLAALVTQIRGIGAWADELDDGIEIVPVPRERLHAALMDTYADHRMATFAAMIGLAVPGTRVRDISTTSKTLPGFVSMWASMLGA
ncbi:3-phosphoshikimate 1-carboxyvinyltransferase [Bifidobacterium bombi]|uniref:3-phosphoshikimate 1-carboxyvinyltransferase n=1 Tax=Bifidobacterium bombi DSM 19703 TaxID=1341695 RepID=A0A080N2H1_9BIFI|nr:3-phosphoshikimate 1-carboxyvinyltransferase [Bifidobacterium bombi]KFF31183.1 3-phosphoshikimate 1-carboxyvinyltransferase [Bifidobacterium bombi DSM 19703]